eukprot:CAMPEP_0173417928 /NCGR_PEP_ID=MMETSP1357-20121228/189_1 /TAXON_ID=77926 /ORGANISM="Hemiselmis rufescens, Strain PCC563" /LENGTH=65 /DNA_ID=CAMNT_0014380317 /DNA_START=356 /DNA_END=549 /DNA_ORIENTATION=-
MEAAGGTGGVCRAQERLDAAQRKLHEAEEADSVDEVWVAKAELGVAKAKVGVAEASGDAVRVAEA